jgi:hypothetical protein
MAMVIKPGGPTDLSVSVFKFDLQLEYWKTQEVLQTKEKP